MAKKENEIFTRMSQQANYEEIVSIFCCLAAGMLREFLLTDERQADFIDMLTAYRSESKKEEDE